MKYENLTLITLNNVLHIKADNLEAVEVDSSCVDELSDLVFKDTKWFIKGKTNDKYYLSRGVDISELSDSIEVRDFETYPITKRAFLLPVKEIDDSLNVVLDNQKELELCLEIVDKKSYTIEEIERAIDDLGFIYDNVKEAIINNLKK